MASYSNRHRDPLLDAATQAMIEKRGKELIGLALIGAGILVAMMIASYSPDDPNWMTATDRPVQNWLGGFGAMIAGPLYMVVGWGSWGLVAVLMAWGLRFVLHGGTERAIGRLIFAPIALAVLSIYASTLDTGPGWTHDFGYGGFFGDTAAGILLTVLPVTAAFGIKILSLILALALLAVGAFVLGFTRPELRQAGRFLLIGTITLYGLLLRGLGKGAVASVTGAQRLTETLQARRDQARALRAERAADMDAQAAVPAPERGLSAEAARVAAIVRANPAMPTREPPLTAATAALDTGEPDWDETALVAPRRDPAHPAPRGGFFARMPGLLKRSADPMPEPELVEAGVFEDEVPEADDDRIRSRISNAIRAKTGLGATPAPARDGVNSAVAAAVASRAAAAAERPSGPIPLLLNTRQRAALDLPPEPPLQATPEAPEPEAQRILTRSDDTQALAPLVAEPLFDADDDAPDYRAAAMPRPQPAEARRVVQHPPRKPVAPSRAAQAEAQPRLAFDAPRDRPAYEHPPLSLLTSPDEVTRHHLSDEALEENARMLESVLDDYGVKGEIVSVRPGPVVTMYELEPAPGLKASRVIGLADDIARSMSALSARVSTVPGRSVIGIELPNENREMVVLREILAARDFGDSTMRLPLALGKDIGGDPVVANLAKMPHLLIAGTTGSGKSVAINTMILSLLYKLTPEECRLIMIDPKMLELSVYDGIPHLLSPVVTDPKKAVVALKWVVAEMEDRYRKMSKMGVRNIEGYNGRVKDALAKGELFSRTVQTGFDDDTGDPVFETEEFAPEAMPYIVVIVDEMADLMMVAGKEIEACIQRLAQMARASGIHLIMATQRPSVDVITGTIKANFPTRISFQVTSKIDSRTILGEQGAEQLLGMGDMLYMAGGSKITRVHGPFCSDEEVEEIVTYLKAYGPPDYKSGVVDGPDEDKEADIDLVLGLGGNTDGEDALYDQAVAIVARDRKCSTSYIQRKLAIGYNKAARLVEQMEEEGVVSSANHVGKREILVPEQA
ncbi:MAG: DNA segregation ATPase FtsK [Rhodobacteraceae bacterium HLUCCA08]|nr:MAG: DNA segregation ATPase FtsK [Rhodobacteraceae bacterium HLUCCA08]